MKCTHCKTLIYPVVGLDIDGTLGQYHQHFISFCALYFGRPMSLPTAWDGVGEFSDFLKLTKQEYREAKLAYRQGGWKRWMPVFPGAEDLVRALHRQDVEVWLCTTRPWLRLDNIDPDTREWCRRNGIEFDGMLFGEDKYSQLLERVDKKRIVAIVDDDPLQIGTATQLEISYVWRAHAFNRGYEKSPSADSMPELLTMLNEDIMRWKDHNGWR